MINDSPEPAGVEPILSLPELASRLGVTAQTIYDLRNQGRGPRGFRLGRRNLRPEPPRRVLSFTGPPNVPSPGGFAPTPQPRSGPAHPSPSTLSPPASWTPR